MTIFGMNWMLSIVLYPNLYCTAENCDEKASSPETSNLTRDEKHRLYLKQQRLLLRYETVKKQKQPLSAKGVESSLKTELVKASLQIQTGDKTLKITKGPETHYDNAPQWTFPKCQIGPYSFGACHFDQGKHLPQAQHLALTLSLSANNRSYDAPLFGLFEPEDGSRAAIFLSENLPHILTNQLNARNADGFTQEGIWNAISLSFMQLQEEFIAKNKNVFITQTECAANHGSSATIILLVNDAAWVAHLGSSRAGFYINKKSYQMTTDPDPKVPEYAELVKSLGGIVKNGLVNEKVGVATGFGYAHLEGAISNKPTITAMPLDKFNPFDQMVIGSKGIFRRPSTQTILSKAGELSKQEPWQTAHDLVISTYNEHTLTSPRQAVQNQLLSCIVISVKEDKAPDDWVTVDSDNLD